MADLDEAIGREESFDVRRRTAADKQQPAFEPGVLAAGPSVLARTDQHIWIELAVEYGEAATWPQQAHPLAIAASGCGKVHST